MLGIKKNLNTFFVLFVAFLMYKAVDNYDYFIGKLSLLLRLLSPFIWAFCISYLLNPLMIRIERTHQHMNRLLSTAIIYIGFIGIVTLLITVVTPIIVRNITDILETLPYYIKNAEQWIEEGAQRFTILDRVGATEYLENNLEDIFNKTLSFLNLTLSGAITSIIGITSGVAKMILAVIISFYMLLEKEKFLSGIHRTNHALLGKERSDKLSKFAEEVDEVFVNFLIGKFIDSLIIGLLCLIGMHFLKVRFAVLMSIVIGITNMIPYFGPFIGAIPAILITLFINPIQAIWVALFILALQQFDGLILGPKILGDKVGISPFYIMLAIILGGGFFGPIGMLIGVPVLKSVSLLWDRLIQNILSKREALERTGREQNDINEADHS